MLQPLSCRWRPDDVGQESPRCGVKAGTPSGAEGRSSVFVPSFFTDVGCCSQRLGMGFLSPLHVSVGTSPCALMSLCARTLVAMVLPNEPKPVN